MHGNTNITEILYVECHRTLLKDSPDTTLFMPTSKVALKMKLK